MFSRQTIIDRVRYILCPLLAGLGVVLGSFGADDSPGVGHLNLTGLSRFWSKASGRAPGPGVLSLGDSLQAPWRSLSAHLNQRLIARLGYSGYSMRVQAWPVAVPTLSSGAQVVAADNFWWTESIELTEGASVVWSNNDHATGSSLGDMARVFYFTVEPTAQFSVLISSNGGPWSVLGSVQITQSDPVGGQASFSLPLGLYRLRVIGGSGRVRLLGPELVNSGSKGIRTSYLARDGVNLGQILSVPRGIQEPLLRALDASLIVWHMKELADIGEGALRARLVEFEELLRAACPGADVLYIGTPFEKRDASTNHTALQNQIVREHAIRFRRAYFDGMSTFVSYESMLAKGYLDDAVHPSNAYYAAASALLWEEAGFAFLGADRHVRIAPSFGDHRSVVSFTVSSGLLTRLQLSQDFTGWRTLVSHYYPGSGPPLTLHYTNTEIGWGMFRLLLGP